MNRFTTDNPNGLFETALNFFYAENGMAMTRSQNEAGNVLNLYDFIRTAAASLRSYSVETYCIDRIAGDYDDDLLAEAMADMLTAGLSTPEGILAHLYMAGWVCAELRERLKKYEDAAAAEQQNETAKLYAAALEKWGVDLQAVVAVEELSELQKEICKAVRGKLNLEHMIEEMADVEIVMEQMQQAFGIKPVEVAEVKEYKLARIQRRIDGEE